MNQGKTLKERFAEAVEKLTDSVKSALDALAPQPVPGPVPVTSPRPRR